MTWHNDVRVTPREPVFDQDKPNPCDTCTCDGYCEADAWVDRERDARTADR